MASASFLATASRSACRCASSSLEAPAIAAACSVATFVLASATSASALAALAALAWAFAADASTVAAQGAERQDARGLPDTSHDDHPLAADLHERTCQLWNLICCSANLPCASTLTLVTLAAHRCPGPF